MTADGDIALIRALFEAVNDGDAAAAGAFLHPEVSMLQGPMPDFAGEHEGKEAVLASVTTFLEACPRFASTSSR